jgi:hypothetical protein
LLVTFTTVLIQHYDGLEDPVAGTSGHRFMVSLNCMEKYVVDLAKRVGKPKEVQMNPKLYYEGKY